MHSGARGAWLCHRRIGIFGRVEQAVAFFLVSASFLEKGLMMHATHALHYLGIYPSVRT